MPRTEIQPSQAGGAFRDRSTCRVVVLWIDWYAYHVARFRGLVENPELAGHVIGLEMVGGIGVHAGLKFRETLPEEMPVETLLPDSNWADAGQVRLAREVWKALSRHNPEAVLVPGYYTLPGLAAALWAKVHRRRSILMTESTRADHQRTWWKEAFKGWLMRSLFDWAVSGGKAHRQYLEDLRFPSDRIAGCYDVVDNRTLGRRAAHLRQRSAAEFGLPDKYFLYVGRLSPEKNVDGLVSAYLQYRRSGGTWSLVIVGDGPQASQLRDLATSSEFGSSVCFAGHKGSADLPPFYAFAGCFVLPSTREPWGLVVNEAMASGVPAIVSNLCGCAPDLIMEGRTGLTFSPSRPDELTSSLHLFGSFSDEHLRRMGANALDHIQAYSPDGFGAEVARILDA